MKKDIDIHEALDQAKKILKTTVVRVAFGQPIFSVTMKIAPTLACSGAACGIFVLEEFSVLRATDLIHALWQPVAHGSTWTDAISNLRDLVNLVNAISACRERSIRDGVTP